MSGTPQTIAGMFQQVKARVPQSDAIVLSDATFSYEMLWQLSRAFAKKFSDHGVGSSSTLQLETTELHIVAACVIASSFLGASIAEASITGSLSKQHPVTHRFGAISDQDDKPAGTISIDDSWSPARVLAQDTGEGTTFASIDADAPWLILSTSGTTGTPKIVPLSQKLMLARSLAVADEYQAGTTRLVSLFPHNCRPFLARMLAALLNGAAVVDKGDWDFWDTAKVNRVTGSVTHAKALATRKYNGKKIATIEVSGAKLQDKNAIELLELFDLVDDTYGATETSKSFSNFLTLSDDGTLKRQGVRRDSMVEIINDDGRLCATGEVGEVRVKNSYCAQTYQLANGNTAAVLDEGYFYPGDLGCWDTGGALEIKTRKQFGVLNIDGVKISPATVEQVLVSLGSITQAAVFENPKERSAGLVAFAVFCEGANVPQQSLLAKKACADRLGIAFAPSKVWQINTIPRQPDGRPDYAQCARMISDAARAIKNKNI